MFKIWVKTLKREKIIGNKTYVGEGQFDIELFHSYLTEMCESMDIPTPVLLSSHIRNFSSFNYVTFTASDFVEPVKFDKLVLEYCREDTTRRKHLTYKAYLPVD